MRVWSVSEELQVVDNSLFFPSSNPLPPPPPTTLFPFFILKDSFKMIIKWEKMDYRKESWKGRQVVKAKPRNSDNFIVRNRGDT